MWKLLNIPWHILIPYFTFYLLRKNYRKYSGLCVQCGSKYKDGASVNISPPYQTPDIENICSACAAKKPKQPFLKNAAIIIILIWAIASISVTRYMAFHA